MRIDQYTDNQHRMGELYTRLSGWMDQVEWYQDSRVFSVIGSMVPGRPRSVLELCCGTGKLLDRLSTTFPTAHVVGVDISPGMVEAARERTKARSNVTVLQGDWIYDLVNDGADPFDVIVIKNALHLLDRPEERLRELGQLSHPLTNLIVVETVSPTPEANAFVQRLFSHIDNSDLKRSFFTDRKLVQLLRRSGWMRGVPKAVFVKQAIDVADWLARKAQNDAHREEALHELVSASTNEDIRTAMEFDVPAGVAPAHMLRLQYICRYYWGPTDAARVAHKRSAFEQLELV